MQQIVDIQDFAFLVRSRRKDLGLSQAQLAAKVGVSRQWIIDIEKGKPRAEMALALALLAALGVQLQAKITKGQPAPQVNVEQGEEKIRDLAEAFDFLSNK